MKHDEVPDWLLERYRLGEVSAEEKARVEALLTTSPALRAALQRLADDDAATLAAHPPARVLAYVRTQAATPASNPNRRWLFAVGAAFALLALGVLLPRAPKGDLLKGGEPSLVLYQLTTQGPVALSDGALVRAGDTVQARVRLEEAGHAVVISFDAQGHVTVHAPSNGASTACDAGTFSTANAFELDATPGFERFVLLTSAAPISMDAVLDAAASVSRTTWARTALLALPSDIHQRSFVLLKESP